MEGNVTDRLRALGWGAARPSPEDTPHARELKKQALLKLLEVCFWLFWRNLMAKW